MVEGRLHDTLLALKSGGHFTWPMKDPANEETCHFGDTSTMDRASARKADVFQLWIDAVGGYRVCLDDEVVLGQPDTRGAVAIPILGDLSQRHARICRDGEGYIIEALRAVRLDGQKIDRVASLRDGVTIQLGECVRLVFRQPHALSATVRLDFVSGHRTQPSADAVLLMADTCVLGPKSHSHVVCPRWTEEVVLYRQEDQLFCRGSGAVEIDGRTHKRRGPITRSSRITGENLSLSLEQIV